MRLVQKDLSITETQLRDYKLRLGLPFPQETYLAQLTELRDRLKAGLSGQNQQDDRELQVSDVAAAIKVLRGTNTVAATASRLDQRPRAAEEPVTTRIRRRSQSQENSVSVASDTSFLDSSYSDAELSAAGIASEIVGSQRSSYGR